MEISAIIVAGGSGKRMGSTVPKQFLPLDKGCILMKTISAFAINQLIKEIIVVLPTKQKEAWQTLCEKHNFNRKHRIIDGGLERFHSVEAGLKAAKYPYVAIHDGVRPFVSQSTLNNCFKTLQVYPAVVPVVTSNESVRLIEDAQNKALNRADIRLVQTPQCFQKDELLKAFEIGYHTFFTDDASVYEQYGGKITLVEGNAENIKITTALDLEIAQKILLNI